ncbi:hypothetical protein QQF64_016056 [Cirrhinus molitorella]|uniref:Uncharacterized protein n=1 Tax=Cirrhinus molitorella TaxID=172907 RepID=A0ABR3LQE0_9TELE
MNSYLRSRCAAGLLASRLTVYVESGKAGEDEGKTTVALSVHERRSEGFPPLDPGVQHFDLSKCLAGVAHKPAGCPRNPHVFAHFKPLLEEQERNEGSREEKGEPSLFRRPQIHFQE